MREKLFEIIDSVQKYCAADGTYCCDCEYNGYDNESCWKYKIADDIINSKLLKDDKIYEVVEHEITIPQVACSNCGYLVGPSLDIISYLHCPNCGVKLKRNMRCRNDII